MKHKTPLTFLFVFLNTGGENVNAVRAEQRFLSLALQEFWLAKKKEQAFLHR